VEPAIDTNEPNVLSLLTKIEEGELDAGIVYMTDVNSAGGGVDGIEIPEVVNVAADYPIAVIVEGSNTAGGKAFVDFVMSGVGQEILAGFGFVTP